MNILTLAQTNKTPEVLFDPAQNYFLIKGRSIPENSTEFYHPVMEWLDKFAASEVEAPVTVEVKLEYFNTSSSKCLVDIFRKLEKMHLKGQPVAVNWYYDEQDEDMKEAGEDFMGIMKLPIMMIVHDPEED